MKQKLSDFYEMGYLKKNKCAFCGRKIGWISLFFNLETIETVDQLFTYSTRRWIFYIICDRPDGKAHRHYAMKLFVCPRCSRLDVETKKKLFKQSYAIHDFFNLDFCQECVSTNVKRVPVLRDGFVVSANYVCQDCEASWGRIY